MFHHRFSTSTVDVHNACHPFSTKHTFESNYVGVHNGVLSNEEDLYKTHSDLGIQYVSMQDNGSFNDSEALVYELARYFEGEVDLMGAKGSIAFIVIKNSAAGKPSTLYFGTNRGALKMKLTRNSLTISSEGDGVDVPDNVLHMWDYENKELRTVPMQIQKSYYYSPTYTGGNYCGSGLGSVRSATTFGKDPYDEDDEYARWENYWDRHDDTRKDSQADRALISQFVQDADIAIREGSDLQIESQLLKESKGSFKNAALLAALEAEAVMGEMRLVDYQTEDADENDDIGGLEDLIDYWTALDTYSKRLIDISHSLNAHDARIIAGETKRHQAGFGFVGDMAKSIDETKILMAGGTHETR